MISEATKQNFAGMYQYADDNNLKLLSCVFTNLRGDAVIISVQGMPKGHVKEVLQKCLNEIDQRESQTVIVP